MKKPSKLKIFMAVVCAVFVFLFLNFFFSMQAVIQNGWDGYANSFSDFFLIKLILSVLVGVLILVLPSNRLNSIENIEVGNK